MANALHPDRMAAAERLDEVASILGAGIRRLLDKHNKQNGIRDVSLDFSDTQSVHGQATHDHGECP